MDPMIKLTFIKGEEGNTFTATGTHSYRCGQSKNYKIVKNQAMVSSILSSVEHDCD